jgi:hypothetical protein
MLLTRLDAQIKAQVVRDQACLNTIVASVDHHSLAVNQSQRVCSERLWHITVTLEFGPRVGLCSKYNVVTYQ